MENFAKNVIHFWCSFGEAEGFQKNTPKVLLYGPRGCPARPPGVRASPATPDPTARGLPPGASASGSVPARPPRAEEGLIARWVPAAGPKCSRSRDGAELPLPPPALPVLAPRRKRPGGFLTGPARAASWRAEWHREKM